MSDSSTTARTDTVQAELILRLDLIDGRRPSEETLRLIEETLVARVPTVLNASVDRELMNLERS